MRWPFRSKSDPFTGGETHAPSSDLNAPVFASSRPSNEWASLPPAPIAISSRPPRMIVGTTSAIRRPIGLRERVDLAEFAAVGVVDGLARITPRPTTGRALPEAPLGEPSALPEFTARVLRALPASAVSRAHTITDAVAVARPAVEAPRAHDAPRHVAPVDDHTDESRGARNTPRPSLAQSRRLGLGPGYHGALPDAMRQDRLDRTFAVDEEHLTETERVPDDLRTIMRAAYGDDVGDQLVHRGADVTEEARQLGARAFARDGEVFVPIDAGPLDEASAKSLLAHELTHLAQQRRRTAPLPAEGSAESQALEAEAQRAERFVRGDPGAPSPGPMAVSTPTDRGTDEFADTQRFVNELVHRGVAEPDGNGGVRFLWGQGQGGGSAARVQRATEPAGTAGQQSNWDALAMAGHSFAESIAGGFEEMIGGEFSFITGIDADLKAAHEARDREFKREQTKEAFGRLRLDHLRVEKRKEVNGAELTEAQERELKLAVDAEVGRRTEAFESRVKHQFEQVNEKLKSENHEPQKELDPDRYDAIFNKLFAEPVGDLPPEDPADDVKAHADQAVNKAKGKQAAVTGAKAGAPPGGGTGGAPTGMSAPGGGKTDAGKAGVIDSWDALKGAFVTDLVTLEAGEFGITLTDEERKGIYDPTGASKTGTAKTADGSAPTSPSPTTPTPTTPSEPGGADKKHIGPSGHEKIDLDRLDLEELTKRLFPRLRSSLRQELIVDRERAGRLNH